MPYKDYNNPKNLAYKKAYYQKNKDWLRVQQKEAKKRWRKRNRTSENKRQSDWWKTKAGVHLKEKNREQIKAWHKKQSENLTERYIIKQLIKDGWTRLEIKQNPEIIYTKRQILKIKRLCKT